MGVRQPPILDTRNMKNTTVCTHLLRQRLARRMGRIITMDAPVVPIQEAKAVPISSSSIGLGRAGQIAFQADIARHTKQAEQQHDKCQVIAHQRFQQLIHHGRHIICKRKRNQEQQRPEQNKQPAPFFPLLRDHQRAYGNTQQACPQTVWQIPAKSPRRVRRCA